MRGQQETQQKKERTPAQIAAAQKLVELNKARREQGALGGAAASSPTTTTKSAASGGARTHRKGGAAGSSRTMDRQETNSDYPTSAPLGIPEGTFDATWVQDCIILSEKYASIGNLYQLATQSWGANNVSLSNQYSLAANKMLVEASNLQTNFRSSMQAASTRGRGH